MLSLLTRKLFMGSKIESRCLKVYEIPFKGGKQKSTLKSIRTWIKYDQNYMKSIFFCSFAHFLHFRIKYCVPHCMTCPLLPSLFYDPSMLSPISSLRHIVSFPEAKRERTERRGMPSSYQARFRFHPNSLWQKLSSSDTLLYSATHIPSISSHNIS